LAQFERELNVISPEQKTTILSARLLQLNAEYTTAQSESRTQGIGLCLGVQRIFGIGPGFLPRASLSKKLSEQMDLQQQKFADVKAHFGANHRNTQSSSANR